MDIVNPRIDQYLDAFSRVDDPVVRKMEAYGAEEGFPIVGPQVGRLLETLAAANGARRVFELGSGFGYSAWFFARAVGDEGEVVLTEYTERLAAMARAFLEEAGLAARATILVGDGFELARAQPRWSFDILFNDAEKEDYPRAVNVARRLLRPGGLLITDNALWYGRVLEPDPDDGDTAGVLEMTRALGEAEDFVTSILPVRDGVAVSVKI